jgi:hypothetical protein
MEEESISVEKAIENILNDVCAREEILHEYAELNKNDKNNVLKTRKKLKNNDVFKLKYQLKFNI